MVIFYQLAQGDTPQVLVSGHKHKPSTWFGPADLAVIVAKTMCETDCHSAEVREGTVPSVSQVNGADIHIPFARFTAQLSRQTRKAVRS